MSAAKKPASYLSAVFTVPPAMADDAAAILIARGALGCAVRPRRVRSNAGPVQLEVFFDRLSPRQFATHRMALADAGMLARPHAAAPLRRIIDPGWATMWKHRFEPLPIGHRFLIVPPWKQVPATKRLQIVINPGQAFGTGHHATTRGVLRVLEALFARRRFRSVLDVGTGSGILAIAMKLLGADRVLAVDNDEIAIANARENAIFNRLGRQIGFSSDALVSIRRRFDLIAANIITATLIDLAPLLQRRLAARGFLVLSGILKSEVDRVLDHYVPKVRLASMRDDRGWVTLVLQR